MLKYPALHSKRVRVGAALQPLQLTWLINCVLGRVNAETQKALLWVGNKSAATSEYSQSGKPTVTTENQMALKNGA